MRSNLDTIIEARARAAVERGGFDRKANPPAGMTRATDGWWRRIRRAK